MENRKKLQLLYSHPLVARFSSAISLFLFLALVSPSVVNYAPYTMAWDDLYFFHRTLCFHHAVYNLSLNGMCNCYSILSKSPIMTFLTLPWGSAGAGESGIGLALVSLAVLIWIIVLAVYHVLNAIGVPRWASLAGAACVFLNPFVKTYGGAFLADMVLSWTVLLLLLLIPLELRTVSPGMWQSINRGLLWGVVLNVGVLAKATFGAFLLPVVVMVLFFRWRRSGSRPAILAAVTAGVTAIPSAIVWLSFGKNFMSHAVASSFGEFSHVYAVKGMDQLGYIKVYFEQCGASVVPLVGVAIYFVWKMLQLKKDRLALAVPVLAVLGYLGLCAFSQNRDYRFALPVMIALPLLLVAVPGSEGVRQARTEPWHILFGLLVAVFFSIPMVSRPDLTELRYASTILKNFGKPATTLLLATDSPRLNIETFLLAKEIAHGQYDAVAVDTLVYDGVQHVPKETSYRKILDADYVLFHRPPLSEDPPWANEFAKDFRTHTVDSGSMIASPVPDMLDVFQIRKPIDDPAAALARPASSR